MVEEFLKIGFEISARGWFSVNLKKGDWCILLKENTAVVSREKGTDFFMSDTYKPKDLFAIFSEHKESEIKLEILPF